MLIEANSKFKNDVYNSWHYLGCPHQRLNENLHSVYRQGIHNLRSLKNVRNYLDSFGFKNTLKVSIELVAFYKTISTQDFNNMNVSRYKDGKLPKFIEALNTEINLEIERTKTYYWNGGVDSPGFYHFKNRKYV